MSQQIPRSVPLLPASFVCVILTACLQDSPRDQFAREVVPVLQRRCAASSCHGIPPGGTNQRRFAFPTDTYGYISEPWMIEATYTAARRFINTTEIPELSSLLRKGLPPDYGGLPHGGGSTYRDRQDPAFLAIRRWIAREHNGGEDGDPRTLSEGERFFAERVQPRLASAQCMLGPCHGPEAGFPLAFDPGIDGTFGVAATRRNYNEAIVHLALGGWPEQSRLIRKALRDVQQRIPHRGGNGIMAFPTSLDDPLARAVIEWARLERRLRTGGAPERTLEGIVFVGGPIGPARVVEHHTFVPGSDLYYLSPAVPGGQVRNLTAPLHTSPADIRHPAVDDTGTRVAFSMRLAPDQGANIWELNLLTGQARKLTESVALPDGSPSMDLWPAYGPDGRIWFVSNRAGTLAEHADGFDTDLYVIEVDGSITRRTHTPSPELATTFFRVGRESAGQVAFTAIRRLGEDYKGLVYRFPNDLHSEYHQHFGITLSDDITFHMRETADGNYLAVLLDREAVWSAGALVLIDRNLGPEVYTPALSGLSLPGFLHPTSFLGPYGSHDDEPGIRRTHSMGAYRDPAPLPDGRVVVSYADGLVALRDRTRPPNFSLYVLTIGRDPSTGQAIIARRESLIDLPDITETEPVPVFRNVSVRVPPAPPSGSTGRLLHGGVPMLENVLRQISPSGTRQVRSDIRAVRILQWIPTSNDPPVANPSPGLYIEQRRSGASPHLPARVLGEIPLESDGTFFAELPANTAFRLQFLDERGMAVGIQHNRWFDINGGQDLRQGISVQNYDRACGHCHGSRSGRPSDAFPVVDLTARASRSLARFVQDDPQRPRHPVVLGPQTVLPAEWRTDVLPLLTRSCAQSGCHDSISRAGGIVLEPRATGRYDTAYETLVARGDGSTHGFRYVDVVGTSARGSYLIERLLGQELDAPRSIPESVPHRGRPALTDNELRTVIRWIESGALYCTEACP